MSEPSTERPGERRGERRGERPGERRGERPGWDERHRRALERSSLEPARLLVEFPQLLQQAPDGRALDVACGNGRNAFFLASLGYRVTAIDFSHPAVDFVRRRATELGVELEAVQTDAADFDPGDGCYAVITCVLFLERNLIPRLIRSLQPGGVLFFETLTIDERRLLGRAVRRDFLLEPNEALHLFAPLRILYYREGVLPGRGAAAAAGGEGGPRAVAQLIAQRPPLATQAAAGAAPGLASG